MEVRRTRRGKNGETEKLMEVKQGEEEKEEPLNKGNSSNNMKKNALQGKSLEKDKSSKDVKKDAC